MAIESIWMAMALSLCWREAIFMAFPSHLTNKRAHAKSPFFMYCNSCTDPYVMQLVLKVIHIWTILSLVVLFFIARTLQSDGMLYFFLCRTRHCYLQYIIAAVVIVPEKIYYYHVPRRFIMFAGIFLHLSVPPSLARILACVSECVWLYYMSVADADAIFRATKFQSIRIFFYVLAPGLPTLENSNILPKRFVSYLFSHIFKLLAEAM